MRILPVVEEDWQKCGTGGFLYGSDDWRWNGNYRWSRRMQYGAAVFSLGFDILVKRSKLRQGRGKPISYRVTFVTLQWEHHTHVNLDVVWSIPASFRSLKQIERWFDAKLNDHTMQWALEDVLRDAYRTDRVACVYRNIGTKDEERWVPFCSTWPQSNVMPSDRTSKMPFGHYYALHCDADGREEEVHIAPFTYCAGPPKQLRNLHRWEGLRYGTFAAALRRHTLTFG